MLWLVAGLIVGASVGMLIACLFINSGQISRYEERKRDAQSTDPVNS